MNQAEIEIKKTIAYNMTYAQGINPESVEKLLKLAQCISDYFEGLDTPIATQAKEALTASKL